MPTLEFVITAVTESAKSAVQDFATSVNAGVDKINAYTDKGRKPIENLERAYGTLKGTGMMALDMLGGAWNALIAPGMEAERVSAQTAATIEATGGVADVTAGEIENLAGRMSRLSGVDDEAAQSANNIILRFTNIHSEVFPRTTSAINDMAVGLANGDVKAADLSGTAQLLGKALDDPLQGTMMLERSLGKFTAAEDAAIRKMVESGNVAGAQAIILDKVESKFKGAAEAAGSTLTGQLAKAETALGNVAEEISGHFIPLVTSGLEALNLILTGHEQLSDLFVQHQEDMRQQLLRGDITVEEYNAEIERSARMTGEWGTVTNGMGGSVDRASDKVRLFTREQLEANKAAADALKTFITTNPVIKELAQRYAEAAEAQAIKATADRVAVETLDEAYLLALDYTAGQRDMLDVEQKLADLNAQIESQGARRAVTVANEKMSEEDLALTRMRLAVATEDLTTVKRRENETDAEFSLRVAEAQARVNDYNTALGTHTAVVGGATKAQLEQKSALEGQIAAFQRASVQDMGQQAVQALTRAYGEGRLPQDEFIERMTLVNRHTNLYTDAALQAAIKTQIMLATASDPNAQNFPKVWADAKRGVDEFTGAIDKSSGPTGEKVDAVTRKIQRIEQEAAPRAATAAEALSLRSQNAWTAMGPSIDTVRGKTDGVESSLKRLTAHEWHVKVKIDVEGEMPQVPSGGPAPGSRAMGGPVSAGLWYLHDDEYVLSKAMREGREPIPGEALGGAAVAGGMSRQVNVTVAAGAVVVNGAGAGATEIVDQMLGGLGQAVNAAVWSGAGMAGL